MKNNEEIGKLHHMLIIKSKSLKNSNKKTILQRKG